MILRGVFAIWIAAVTLASVYLGHQVHATPHADDEEANTPFDFFKTQLVAIPHVKGNDIDGYIMGRFTVKYDPKLETGSGITVAAAVMHAMNQHFFSEGEILANPQGWTGLRRSLDELKVKANRVAGRDVVMEVLIDQLDYFQKEEVRMPSQVARMRQ